MSRIIFGSVDLGGESIFLDDGERITDVINGRLYRFSDVDQIQSIRIVEQMWKSILITTDSSFIWLSMQDRFWIFDIKTFTFGSSGDTIIQEVRTFGEGLDPTEAFSFFFGSIGNSFELTINDWKDRVTVYFTRETPDMVRGSDGRYYNMITGDLVDDPIEELSVVIPVDYDNSIYNIELSTKSIIVAFNRFGDISWSTDIGGSGSIIQYNRLSIPCSLVPSDDSIEIKTIVNNLIVDRRLDEMITYQMDFSNYSNYFAGQKIYFVFGDDTPYYQPKSEGYFNLKTRLMEDIPEFPLVEVRIPPEIVELQVTIRTNPAGFGEASIDQHNWIRISDRPVTDDVFSIKIQEDSLRNSLYTLARSLYDPIPIPNVIGEYRRITLEEARQIVGTIAVPPLFQPFSGPPGSPNRIVTIVDPSGNKFFYVDQ